MSSDPPPAGPRAALACCFVSGHGRPSVDVHTSLESVEWRELFAEALRLSGFWAWTAGVTAVVLVAASAAAALGTPLPTTLAAASTALAAVAVFTIGYTVVGPRLRWPRLTPDVLAVHWRVHADRIEAHRAGSRFDLDWHDVDQVVVTHRLVVLRLGERREVLGLPRRAATPLGESLITGWAEDSGAEVVRRRSSHHPPRRDHANPT